MFRHLAPASPTSAPDALEMYLSSPRQGHVLDPLEYWHARAASGWEAPLVRMALDFLSVPGKLLNI